MSQEWAGFRLSKQQEHVLGLASGGLAGRTVAGVGLPGPVDREVLELAARDVVAAHESLRTAYRQVLGENSTVLMVIEDDPRVHAVEAAGDGAALAALARAETPGAEHVPRLILFAHADGRRSLVVSAPRLSMDGASARVFFRDLGQAYASRLRGTPWSRDDVVQYADYAQWQFEEGAPSDRQREAAAGRDARLADLPPLHLPLELRCDAAEHEDLTWTLPAPLAGRLRSLARELDAGLRGVLLTGWLAALWHATGRPERLAVCATLTRRPFQELLGSIGQFATPMPVLAAIDEETTLDGLLRAVDLELDSAEQAGESAMQPARQHARTLPGFACHDAAAPEVPGWSGLWVEPADEGRKVGLSVLDVDGEVRLTLRHQAGGLAEGGAEALLACLRATVAALGGDLSATVHELAMLDEEAARALVTATNPAEPPMRTAEHWHRRFERSAERVPGATALRSATRTWTYRDLDQAADRLAGELADRGVGPGTLVGLHLERSALAVVSMLAIAKAGAAYVPVDPSLPAGRRFTIMAAAGFTHVVATQETAADLPAGCEAVLVDEDLTSCAGRPAVRPDVRPDVRTTDDDPAYVLFTSGSTGVPKGVRVGHGQLAAYLDGVLDRLGLTGPVDSVALSTLGTDLGNTALFPPLLSGGELLVVAPEVSADAQALAELLSEESYDLLKITPTHLESVFAVADAPERLMPRQALVVGGEPFGWGAYNLFRGFLGGCRLYNHYGPTETTVGVLCGEVTSGEAAVLASTVPLGTPMRHARAYVLDPRGRPLPAGLPGELWIGGSSVSQGYLSGTAEQRERFAADPFSPEPSARMYRSGDKVRLLPGGSVEFLGRTDRQVKVRGFRVELGEIEAVMRRHPRVTGSLAVEAGESAGAHLVGYLIDAEGGRGPAEWLRPFLAERLPEFMIPAHLVALDAFPVTSTGKIDASMLPEPGSFAGADAAAYVEPRTGTEARVAGIVARLLLLNRVGADDDFFDVGGHSLLATQLIAKLRDDFKVDIKLRNLFERPVVSELAEFIDGLLEKKAEES
ncbi:non-ribosomal peptide synthetase [Nonomuraea gerenzanensis]|uniref:Siderophore biosynthesis non-ribosomal peptide synthetase modules n=1 Tax=Nonomuraea gerenzanensis TaxID=93944 RepID=A0A1M4EFN4_9ACTN|nr:non-ribosomal peptide synthetase [Nonomuraea gerenzanensis]UBU09316.1 amino acid adenylation domain-containing protein [Nonomuraea gerenzanensis]SBO97725.1 Siderophore biosynthesis non-ribosomal peptide synthetase modules [Nonomuraea gerenzanensis]